MTLCDRPHYARRVVDALRRCRGIEHCILVPHIESGCPENVRLVKSIDFMAAVPVVNVERLGGPENSFRALDHAFYFSSFVVHLEDDTVPAPDLLEFFDWCNHAYRDDERVFTVSAMSRSKRPVEGADRWKVALRPRFTSQCFGMWRDRWEEVRSRWDRRLRAGCDHMVEAMRGGRLEAYPLLQRFLNIGIRGGFNQYHKGKYDTPRDFYFNEVYNERWSGTDDVPPGDFHG